MPKQELTTVEDCIQAIEKLHADILFAGSDEDGNGGPGDSLPPQSTQAFLKGLSHLKLAQAEMQMADYLRMRKD